MKLLHTSDWHVGRTIRGRSRVEEHQAVLAEIVGLAAEHEVDLVLVAGDLFETAAPTAEAERLVYRTLLDLAGTGAEVAVVSGNHDNARRLHAVAPVFEAARGVHLLTEPTRPADGGVRLFSTRAGEEVRLALLPFVSQRGIVRARDLMDSAAFEYSQAYADRLRMLTDVLTADFATDTVNLLMGHAFVVGGALGGGERMAHFIEDYAISSQIFPASASYVALGHVHRAQRMAGAAPIHYCGSPLQLDFGDHDDAKQVNLVEVEAGLPATVTPMTLTQGRALRTVSGTVAQLEALVADAAFDPEAWLRVVVEEPARAGLADEVRALLGERAVDVRITTTAEAPKRTSRKGRTPQALFDEFLTDRSIDDPRLRGRFADLLDAHLEGAET